MTLHNQPLGMFERKDDSAVGDVKKAVDGMMVAFEEFKFTNDARLAEIAKRGAADPVVTDKLAKIEEKLSSFEGLNQRITQAEAQTKATADLIARFDELETRMGRPGAGGFNPNQTHDIRSKANTWARAVVDAHLKGVPNLTEDQRKALDEIAAEYKSLGLNNDTGGGYLAPVQYVQEILKTVTLISPARSLARVRTTGAKSMQIPKRTGQFSAQWTGDQAPRTETAGLAYGMDEITAHEMFALIDISQQNLEDSAFDLENEVSFEATEQFAVAEGAAFVSGNGVAKPIGFLNSADVLTTNSGAATTVTSDGILSLKYGIKSAYARNAKWVMNRTTLGSVRKLKDSNGRYIWMPGIANGAPNTIDGDPYVETPDMPNEGAGLKPVAYGDFMRGYTLVDRIAMTMLRDPYTQATAGNIRFIFRRRLGGQVVMPEAIRIMVCSV